ncbi:MAG: Gfo/Idh/MocA family oxidoreductase [Steroidobacteraceae bacterium]
MNAPARPLGIALIGCGRISRAHAAAIAACPSLARLVAVVDTDLARAREFAGNHGVPLALDDLGAALARPEVDAVLICTPNALHAQQSIQALAAGKHVLVEKPMAENTADAQRMADAAERAQRVLAIGQTMRHTHPIRWLQDHRQEFGPLRAVEVSMCVRWDGPQAPWWKDRKRQQGLILSLFAPHALDFVQLVFAGEQPINVHAEVSRFQQDWAGEDEAMILLRYPGGRLAQVHISYNQRFIVDRRTVHFDKGMVRIEDGDWGWFNADPVVVPEDPSGDPKRMGGRELGGHFRLQLGEFVKAVRGEPHRSVLHAEGVHLTRLIERVIESGLRNSGEG